MIRDTLRRIGGHRAVLPLTARVLCAQIVEESPAFFMREVVRPAGVSTYRLRENGLRVALRHRAQDAATLAEVFRQHDYLPDDRVAAAIGNPRKIIDLGANIGLFGVFASHHWPEAEILAYEADPENAFVHAHTIVANGLAGRWRLVQAAAGAHDGVVELAAGRAMGSFVVQEGVDPGLPTIPVPIEDVIPAISSADLVKIDIEGGEWEIVMDPRFTGSPPRALVLEYHPHFCPEDDPRTAVEHALARAGLTTAAIWHRDDGYGMLWAWRT